MTSKSDVIVASSLHTHKRNADEYRLVHGTGANAVYCGHITYSGRHGWDAYNFLDHRYLPTGPFGPGPEGLAKATDALKKAIIRRGSLRDGWAAE